MKNYYYILGVKETASFEEIKSAYRKLSKKFHPDNNPEDKFFEERFKDIQEGYATLSDNQKRKIYDEQLNEFNKKAQAEFDKGSKKNAGDEYGIEPIYTAMKSKNKHQEKEESSLIDKFIQIVLASALSFCFLYAIYDLLISPLFK